MLGLIYNGALLNARAGYPERGINVSSVLSFLLYGKKKKSKLDFPVLKKKSFGGIKHCHRCLTFLFLSFWLIGLKAINVSLAVLLATESDANNRDL